MSSAGSARKSPPSSASAPIQERRFFKVMVGPPVGRQRPCTASAAVSAHVQGSNGASRMNKFNLATPFVGRAALTRCGRVVLAATAVRSPDRVVPARQRGARRLTPDASSAAKKKAARALEIPRRRLCPSQVVHTSPPPPGVCPPIPHTNSRARLAVLPRIARRRLNRRRRSYAGHEYLYTRPDTRVTMRAPSRGVVPCIQIRFGAF
jgi:hypothetical protein